MSKKQKKQTSKFTRFVLVVLGIAAALVFCAVMGYEIIQLGHKNAELRERRSRLERLIAEQEQRQEELADEAEYVKTQKYIEEKAKAIGYVYPDEIIFKRDDD